MMSSATRSLDYGAALSASPAHAIAVPARPGLFEGWFSPFRLCGYVGLVLGVSLGFFIADRIGFPLSAVAVLAAAAVLTFFGLAAAAKAITGEEMLVYHHHEIAILIVASAAAWLLGMPVLSALDITIISIGTFLLCGRVGCLLVGCCHGRPHRWGVCYGRDHAEAGFPSYYVGVPLFPVQGLEAVMVAAIVLVGCAIMLNGSAPGSALLWYLVSYNLGRFLLEFLRGDPERFFYRGFSEAQWVALIITSIIALTAIPHRIWLAAPALSVGIAMIVLTMLRSRFGIARDLLHPHHVREIAGMMRSAERSSGPDALMTSRGIIISSGTIEVDRREIHHYALSGSPLNHRDASVLARLLLRIGRHDGRAEMVIGSGDVFHLLVHPRREDEAVADGRVGAER